MAVVALGVWAGKRRGGVPCEVYDVTSLVDIFVVRLAARRDVVDQPLVQVPADRLHT